MLIRAIASGGADWPQTRRRPHHIVIGKGQQPQKFESATPRRAIKSRK